jgi:hypothetical protein
MLPYINSGYLLELNLAILDFFLIKKIWIFAIESSLFFSTSFAMFLPNSMGEYFFFPSVRVKLFLKNY